MVSSEFLFTPLSQITLCEKVTIADWTLLLGLTFCISTHYY